MLNFQAFLIIYFSNIKKRHPFKAILFFRLLNIILKIKRNIHDKNFLIIIKNQSNQFMGKYVIVSPVRNEEDYIEKTIQSVTNQTVLPSEYIIVNDGSTDHTTDIIDKYLLKYPWIHRYDKPKGEHCPGTGVIEAFYTGFNKIENNSWDFVVKLDGDLSFEPDYFEFQLQEFNNHPKLGMTSGVTYQPNGNQLIIDKMPEDHVRGAAKMYRRTCIEQIGGIPKVLGWDTIDELKAQLAGWETRSYKHLVLIHYKPIGFKQTNVIKRELKAGERQHYLGYHPVFAILKNIYRMLQKPFIIAGTLNLTGFFMAYIMKKDKIELALIKLLRNKQIARMTFKRKFW
jgi:poly-beta-1,6-N-acetyl-D-glucosamine synthase